MTVRSRKIYRCTGVSLIELMVVLVLGLLGIFAVSTIATQAIKEWKRSNEVASLQADFDLASYMIKNILEEASSVEILSSNRIRATNQAANWIQEFYQNSSDLIWKNVKTNLTQKVITTVKTISFAVDPQNDSLINVSLTVKKGTREISGSFSVFMRNLK